jgi:hypothetical protein
MDSKNLTQDSSDDRKSLQEKWRILCMLFALVTAQNYGKPKLYRADPFDLTHERNRKELDQRLFDLVPLFPRDSEIIASVIRKPSSHAQTSVVSVVDVEPQPIFNGYAASVANPDTRHIKGNLRNKTKKTQIRLAQKGTSDWNLIEASEYLDIAFMK